MNETNQKKRVLVVTGIYPPDIGGPATYLAQFVPYLVAHDVAVRVVTFGDEESSTNGAGVSVIRIARSGNRLLRMLRFFRAVHRESKRTDLMYVHDISAAGSAAYLASVLTHIPYLLRIGGDFVWEQAFEKGATTLDYHAFQGNEPFPYSLRRALAARIARAARAVVVPSTFLATAVKKWGVAETQLHVVPNAIDEQQTTHADTTAHPLIETLSRLQEGKVHVAVASGRFVRWKHFELVIDAVRDVPNVHLVLIGAGPEEASLKARIAEHGLTDRVTLISSLPRIDLAEVLRHADCFVLPSEGDTFSFIALEAFLAGTPVVLARAGAFPEIFGAYEGEGVYFLPELSASAITDVLQKIDTLSAPSDMATSRIRTQYALTAHFEAVWGIMAPHLTRN